AIEVESEPGRGTTFYVTLHAGSDHLPQDRIGAERRAASAPDGAAAYVSEAERWLPSDEGDAPAGDSAGVLAEGAGGPVADADRREYAARLLRPDWIVETVADGAQALTAIAERPPDLVLTDVMMPNLDGAGLLSAVRRNPATAHIPVIMLSARAGEEARIEG